MGIVQSSKIKKYLKTHPRRRVRAAAGRLTVFAWELYIINLKQIDHESANNIRTGINDTLDLLEQSCE